VATEKVLQEPDRSQGRVRSSNGDRITMMSGRIRVWSTRPGGIQKAVFFHHETGSHFPSMSGSKNQAGQYDQRRIG
jgi:hypothetical protein